MPGETSKKYLLKLLNQAAEELGFDLSSVKLDLTVPDARFGDYSTNAALILGKQLKRSPQEIATVWTDKVKDLDSDKFLKTAEVVKGFLNFTLSEKVLEQNLQNILEQRELYGCSLIGEGKKVVFEYSSPNTNKPLHIGHTRNDVYGVACINLLKATGHKVISCKIINDRGIHIMKSVLMYLKHGKSQTPESAKMKPDHFVGKFYQMFAQESSENPEKEKQLLAEAQELLQKWEAGDENLRKVWQQMNDWWQQGVEQTYQREGSFFDEVDYEHEIYDKGRDLVLEGVKKGIFTKEADGGVVIDLTEEGLDKKYLLRKDGTTLYITQDMYLWHLRDQKHHPDQALVTTSAEQAYHFKVLSRVFEALNFPWAKNFKHLPYEHVYLGESKMSSREGNTISADELVESVKKKILEVMEKSEKVKASAGNDKLIESIAFGAIKYGYLKYEPNTRIYFDLDQTISIEGNTGPYIQYAHARISSILKNAPSSNKLSSPSFLEPQEIELMRKLLHFGEAIEQAAKEFKPNLLCNYLYELAGIFNRFYQEVSVLKEEDVEKRSFRLNLITATAQVIANGLYLLGIESPEEM